MDGTILIGLLAVLAALSFTIYFLLSIAVLSAASLSRVSLHVMSVDDDGKFHFIEAMDSVSSSYRLAAQIVRQVSLLAGSGLVVFLAYKTGSGQPLLIGLFFGGLFGVYILECLTARFIALKSPRAALRLVAPVLPVARFLAYPMVMPLVFILKRAASTAPRSDDERDEEQEEEVEAYFEVGEREGILEADEGKMMRSIIDLGDTRVREIMTPRTDIEAFHCNGTVADARQAMLRNGHSRMPVYREGIDNIVGILHMKDLVQAWNEGREEAPIMKFLRSPFFVPETQMVSELLAQLRTRTNMALVVDEYGGIAGLVTMEDILEEIVGDIRDEHDTEEEQITENDDGTWTYSGLVRVEQLEENFGIDIDERDFDTVGGLVISRLGRVPGQGEALEFDGLHITVVRADPRRVYMVRIRQVKV